MVNYKTRPVLREIKTPARSDITMSLAFSSLDALSCSIILRTYTALMFRAITRALVLFMDKLSVCFCNITAHINYLPFNNANIKARLYRPNMRYI